MLLNLINHITQFTCAYQNILKMFWYAQFSISFWYFQELMRGVGDEVRNVELREEK